MKRLGIIDIGSNSIRLLLVEILSSGSYKIIDELKESVRLGADMIDGIRLNEERITKAIWTIKSFKIYCDAVHVKEIIAIATEAVRRSENKNDFIERVKIETDIEIRILTGVEEAYYDYFGVTNSMYIDNSLIVDIGGSSTELAWVYNNKLMESISIPIGAVNLTQKFNLEDIVNYLNEEKLREYLISIFNEIPWLFKVKFSSITGIGGTARNLGKIDRKNKRYVLDIHHNYEMEMSDVHTIYNSIKSKGLKQRKRIDGLSEDRADIFVGPCCAILSLLQLLEIDKIFISGKGLREGILYEYITTHYTPIEDVLDFSIKNVMQHHYVNQPHALNVYKLTSLLFENLKPLHHLNGDFSRIIKTATLLHDCGLSIRYYDHHKHSFYIILNSEINGLSHKELILSAYTASAHCDGQCDMNIFQFHGIINKMDLVNVEKIGCLLRIAESLDKSMSGLVKDILFTIENDSVTLKVISDHDIELEVNDAQKSASFFSEVYDRQLLITT